MNVHPPVLLGSGPFDWVGDAGHVLAEGARGIIDLGKRVRGDTSDVVVNQSTGIDTNTKIIYGALAAVAIFMVVKK